MTVVDIFDVFTKFVRADYVLYGVCSLIAGGTCKTAWNQVAAKRKYALEQELKSLQTERFDALNELVADARDRITRAEIIIKELESENGTLKNKLYVATMRVQQLERQLVKFGHSIPQPLHLNPGP